MPCGETRGQSYGSGLWHVVVVACLIPLRDNIGRTPHGIRKKHTPLFPPSSPQFYRLFLLWWQHSAWSDTKQNTKKPTSKQGKSLVPVREGVRKPYIDTENIIDDNNEHHACAYPLPNLHDVYEHIPPTTNDYLLSQSGPCAPTKSGRIGHDCRLK